MKIIFLDFDGVLNSWRFFKDSHANGLLLFRPADQIDPKAIRWLNELITKSGAKVVVSSAWRLLHTLDELRAMLGEKGFAGEVIDRTESLSWQMVERGPIVAKAQRGDEIDLWVRAHAEVESFVILDDDSDMAMHAGRLVQTSCRKGLKQIHVEQAIALLESPAQEQP